MAGFAGKKVLITGGSKGIGRSLALKLAAQGASVVVAARGQAALDETVAAMQAVGKGTFGAVSFDVSDPVANAAGCARAIELLGGLDVLVCNSGYSHPGKVLDLPADVFEEMLRVNYLGHVHTCRAAAPAMVGRGSGQIVLVSSMLGFLGLYGYGAYSASKFAIWGFGQAFRQEMAQHRVAVSVFFPPTTETPGLVEENKVKPKEVWALEADNSFSKTYSADAVADALLAHLRAGRFEGVVGADSWFIHTMNRFLPGFTRWMADRELAAAIRKTQAG